MNVFILEPKMTMIKVDEANIFNEELIHQFSLYGLEHYLVGNTNIAITKQKLVSESLVIVYNEHLVDDLYNEEAKEFIEKAKMVDSEIWPVSIDRETRTPVGIISNKQSYDIWEQLRCRNLDRAYLPTIAKIFSRKIVARVYPTFYCEKGEIFLSHKRIDGEEITAKLYDKILVQARESKPFRDVVNVRVGDAAQTVIDEAMENSDVFIFVHTPKACESDWILKELRFALLRNVPVLWIQIDNADVKKLKIKPSDKPHLRYNSEDFEIDEKLVLIVDEILENAYGLIMERSNQVLDFKNSIDAIFGDNIKTVDKNKMIYHISMARKGYHYPQRNIEQYYQLFGRTPTSDDAKALRIKLKDVDADSLTILTNRVISSSTREAVVFDSIFDFCYYWDKYVYDEKIGDGKMEIVLSGAFSDSDEIFKQSLTDALTLFSKAIIQSGYSITFGAHPTFQNLFYEVAKETDPINYKERINMYISEWFLADQSEKENEYSQKYNLFVTSKKDELGSSLTEMRKNMIQRENVKALVCLGGKIKPDKNQEGIREEIEIARKFNIPVFIVGSVGGCSSIVAMEYKDIGWEKINNAGNQLNERFMGDVDYYGMAKDMMRYISLE